MPHIDVKLFPGRDEATKKAFADKIVELGMQELGAAKEHLSVSVEEIAPDKWNEEVADKVDESKVVAGKVYRA